MVQFSNGLDLAMAIVPNIHNSDTFPGFQMVCDKMAAICRDIKWLRFRISDPIRNSEHLQSNLFLNIWNPD